MKEQNAHKAQNGKGDYMYLRTKLQTRAHENLKKISEQKYPDMRITKGYVVSELLMSFRAYIRDPEILQKAILESDMKEEGGGIAVNLNITAAASEELQNLKSVLDIATGRSLFPAQVLDILLICVVNTEDEEIADSNQVSNKELAHVLLDMAYKLLTEETLSINLMNAKTGLIEVLTQNYLL